MGVKRYNKNFDAYIKVVARCGIVKGVEELKRLTLIADSLKKLLVEEDKSLGTYSTPNGEYKRDRAHVNTNNVIKHP